MSGYILHGESKEIVMSADAVERLVCSGNADAALLYLELQRLSAGVTAQQLMQRLRWSQLRLNAAEKELQRLGLLPQTAPSKPLDPPDERPVYTTGDLSEMLQSDREFQLLVPQTEEKLGKKLKTADLQILAGLYDDLFGIWQNGKDLLNGGVGMGRLKGFHLGFCEIHGVFRHPDFDIPCHGLVFRAAGKQ